MNRPDPAAVLVLRVWRGGPGRNALRARITRTTEVTQPGRTTAVAGSIDDVCAVVKDWIEEFVRGTGGSSKTFDGCGDAAVTAD